MSKYFDETLKAQQQKVRVSEPGPVDVVSLLDAIKQEDPTVTEVAEEVAPVIQRIREIRIPKLDRSLTVVAADDTSRSACFVEAYHSLRTRLMKVHDTGVHSIMLTSSVTLEGKTLTALNLALVCAQLNDHRVLLVDGDLRSRGLTRLLQIESETGLSEILSGATAATEAVFVTGQSNLHVLAAGTSCRQTADLFAGPRWSEFMEWAKQTYSIVLVDGPPIHLTADAELISAGCDGTLLVIRARSTPRELALSCADRLDKNKFLGLILNGVSEREGGYDDYYYGTPSGTTTNKKV